ncbi:MAG TPA: zinc ribbon domain-containing protein [Phycisphaerales bacterium]|nr:zinc ribbon domain-containing protein [Phycisphaerales bacterium]
MPTYDYKCKACGHTWELFQSMSAKPEKACPACGKKAAERLIGTGAALLFKGSGFYETDYRSESYKKAAEADKKSGSAAAGGGGEGDSAKTGAKPADAKTDKPAESKTPASDAKPKASKASPDKAPKAKKKGGE